MRAVVAERAGAPDVLVARDVDVPEPGAGQVRVRVAAAGVNFIDTYQRSGAYAMAWPAVLGLEGAGTVDAVGEDVDGVTVGDRVAWAQWPGSYAEQVVVAAPALVPVPDDVPLEVAAALLLQGLTAHYLAVDTVPLTPATSCSCTPAPAAPDGCWSRSRRGAARG